MLQTHNTSCQVLLLGLNVLVLNSVFCVLQGIRGNTTDACEDHDPCQHGGICISTDSGPICECRNVDFEGIFCEKGRKMVLIL
jgi:leucine-rich repeat transmembrane neuronal protein 1/2